MVKNEMANLLLRVIASLIFLLPLNLYPQEKEKSEVITKPFVAILGIDSQKFLKKSEEKLLADALLSTVQVIDKFEVLDRSNMDKIFKEQKFQLSGACDSSKCSAEAGKMLGVDKIITGNLGMIGKTYQITIILTAVSTGKIEKSSSRKYKGEIDGLLNVIEEIGYELCGEKIPFDIKNKTEIQQIKPSANFGDIQVTTDPEGAKVIIDNIPVADKVTPLTIEKISAGAHEVKAILDNYSGQAKVTVEKETTINIVVPLSLEKGNLKVVTTPLDAFVYIDEEFQGKSPVSIEPSIGKHTIKVRKSGYIKDSREIIISNTKPVTENFILKEKEPEYDITFNSTPEGATVSINGEDAGTTPLSVKLKKGEYSVLLEKDGFASKKASLPITKSRSFETKLSALSLPTGFISIVCSPSGNKIYLDDKFAGMNFILKQEASEGTHTIKCVKQNYQTEEFSFYLTENQDYDKTIHLEPYRQKPVKKNETEESSPVITKKPEPPAEIKSKDEINPKDLFVINLTTTTVLAGASVVFFIMYAKFMSNRDNYLADSLNTIDQEKIDYDVAQANAQGEAAKKNLALSGVCTLITITTAVMSAHFYYKMKGKSGLFSISPYLGNGNTGIALNVRY